MPLVAHVGGRTDLPVPLGFFVAGAGLAVVISFVMVSSSWTRPRLQGPYRRTTAGSHWVGRISWLAAVIPSAFPGSDLPSGSLEGHDRLQWRVRAGIPPASPAVSPAETGAVSAHI